MAVPDKEKLRCLVVVLHGIQYMNASSFRFVRVCPQQSNVIVENDAPQIAVEEKDVINNK
jgi:hypothetical protein